MNMVAVRMGQFQQGNLAGAFIPLSQAVLTRQYLGQGQGAQLQLV